LDREIAERKHAKLHENMEALTAEKAEFEVEYQRQKLLAELRADWHKIREKLRELAHEIRLRIQSIRENLQRRKAERALDMVTERGFAEVLKRVLPGQARELRERRVRGKEKEIELDIC